MDRPKQPTEHEVKKNNVIYADIFVILCNI